jgi:hypothetical protein
MGMGASAGIGLCRILLWSGLVVRLDGGDHAAVLADPLLAKIGWLPSRVR